MKKKETKKTEETVMEKVSKDDKRTEIFTEEV